MRGNPPRRKKLNMEGCPSQSNYNFSTDYADASGHYEYFFLIFVFQREGGRSMGKKKRKRKELQKLTGLLVKVIFALAALISAIAELVKALN